VHMKRISLLLLPCLILLIFKLSAPAQRTAFTYQGRLTEGDAWANGTYDFQFSLFSSPSSGTSLFAFSTNNVPVSNGLFTVTLDFGESAFPAADRWLEIAVRADGALGFVTVSPRQPVTSTPYAIRALSAGSVPSGAITSAMLADGAVTAQKLAPRAVSYLGAPDGSPTNALVVNASGLVGIGTNDPRAGLDISASAPILSARRLFQVRDETASYTNLATARSLAAFGNLLAVLGGADDGVTVLSVSSPQSPILRSQFREGDGGFTNLRGALGLAMRTNLLAVAAFVDNAVTLVSLTNPSSPVRLAELRDSVSGWNELSGARAVAISGNLMAIAAQTDNAVTLADISNPLAPVKRAEMKDGVGGFANLAGAYSVTISGNLLAIGARLDRTVTLVDISDPANPLKQAELTDGLGGYDNLQAIAGIAFSGQLLAITAWAAISDRDAKKNFQALKGKEILEKLATLPIQRWNYKWESDHDVPHIGPVAQDFKAAFYPGRDDRTITTLEFDGVALAAIQGLNQKVEELKRQNQQLQQRLQKLEALLEGRATRVHRP
jgi:hypothetical protein